MTTGPVGAAYAALVAAGELRPDPDQAAGQEQHHVAEGQPGPAGRQAPEDDGDAHEHPPPAAVPEPPEHRGEQGVGDQERAG